jgi:hypothetical protein
MERVSIDDLEPTHESFEEAIEDTGQNGEPIREGEKRYHGRVVIQEGTDQLDIYSCFEKFCVFHDEEKGWCLDLSGSTWPPQWVPEPRYATPFEDLLRRVDDDLRDLLDIYAEETGNGPIVVLSSADDNALPLDAGEHYFGPPGWEEDLEEWALEYAHRTACEMLEDTYEIPSEELIEKAAQNEKDVGRLRDLMHQRAVEDVNAPPIGDALPDRKLRLLKLAPHRNGELKEIVKELVVHHTRMGDLKESKRVLDAYFSATD